MVNILVIAGGRKWGGDRGVGMMWKVSCTHGSRGSWGTRDRSVGGEHRESVGFGRKGFLE